MKNFLKMIKILIIVSMFSFVACDQAGSGSSDETTVLKSDKAITAFDFAVPAVVGVIDEATYTVALTVPFGTVVTALIPTITHTGVDITPASGIANNFTTPQTYTVEAEDGTTQDYIVTVTITPPSTSKAITAFVVVNGVTTIDESLHKIDVVYTEVVIAAVELKAAPVKPIKITPTITHTGVSVNPASGVQVAFSYGTGKTYTVTAEDGSTQNYTVTITKATP